MPSAATTTRVDLAGLLDFIRTRHRVVLTTRRADGSPQLSPVTAGVDDAGRIVVSTHPERAKAVNLRRHPTVSVLVLSDEWNGPLGAGRRHGPRFSTCPTPSSPSSTTTGRSRG